MPLGGRSDSGDPAEAILTAVHKARHSTLLKCRKCKESELHADVSEGLPLISAFVRIEDAAVRSMLTRVIEMLAET